jgi:hypothetical protein
LVLGQDPVLLDDEGHDGVGVQALQEHEHEAGREEKVNQDRLDSAKLKSSWQVNNNVSLFSKFIAALILFIFCSLKFCLQRFLICPPYG